jgi:hypothetical protein
VRVKTRLLASLALILLAATGPLMAQPAPSYTENGFNPRMLDASAPRAARLKLFAQMIALANSGQVRAQDLAGTFYWQGAGIKGSPVKRDLSQARILLSNAAVHGDVMAMAKLGELELQAGRLAQAMVWAQMYARYHDPLALQRDQRGQDSAYASNLIKRITDAGGKIDKAASKHVGAMVARFDTSIRRGIDAYNKDRRTGRTRLVQDPAGVDASENVNVNGMAEYMVAFQPDGKPGKIWLLDAVPKASMDDMLRHYLDHALANSVAESEGTRYLRVSIVHNAQKFRVLRPVH